MAGMSIGLAQGALERFLAPSGGRPIRGTTYKGQFEARLTHLMLAEVHSQDPISNADDSCQRGVYRSFWCARGRRDRAHSGICQAFSARVLVETAYAAKWCAETIEILQRSSGSNAIIASEPIQRCWRDGRVISLHGALNLETVLENYGRLTAGKQPHQFAGITTLNRFAPAAVKNVP